MRKEEEMLNWDLNPRVVGSRGERRGRGEAHGDGGEGRSWGDDDLEVLRLEPGRVDLDAKGLRDARDRGLRQVEAARRGRWREETEGARGEITGSILILIKLLLISA